MHKIGGFGSSAFFFKRRTPCLPMTGILLWI
jgi:hypothetical protein